jgi:uncharacterized protein (DUF427 family)
VLPEADNHEYTEYSLPRLFIYIFSLTRKVNAMKIPREQSRESVWDYPRPPRIEPSSRLVRVVYDGRTIAETTRALRVLETSHPPAYYIPPGDIQQQFLQRSVHQSYCEFKGAATYYTLETGQRVSENAAWSYHSPSTGYESLEDYIAFYPGRVDACYVDEERVHAQEGDFYGGWITSDIEGPFKGGPGTLTW